MWKVRVFLALRWATTIIQANFTAGRDIWSPQLAFQGGAAIGSLGNGGGAGDWRIIFGAKFTPSDIFKPKQAEQVAAAPAPVVHEEETTTVAPPPIATPHVVFTKKEIKISEEVKFETAKDALTPSGRALLTKSPS